MDPSIVIDQALQHGAQAILVFLGNQLRTANVADKGHKHTDGRSVVKFYITSRASVAGDGRDEDVVAAMTVVDHISNNDQSLGHSVDHVMHGDGESTDTNDNDSIMSLWVPLPEQVPLTCLVGVDDAALHTVHTVPTDDAVDTVSEPIVLVDLPTAESETIDEGRYATMVAFPPSFRPGSADRGSDVHAVTHDDMADDALDTGDIVTVVEHPHTMAEQLAAARAIIAAMQTAHSATDNATTQTDLTGDALDEKDSELAGAYRVQSALADELAAARR